MGTPIVQVSCGGTVGSVPVAILHKRNYRADCCESQEAKGSRKYGDDGHLDFLLFDLFSDVFGSPSDHQTTDENGHYCIDQHAVQTSAYTPEDHLIRLNIEHRHEPAQRSKAVVHADHSAATCIRGHGRKQ